MTEKDIPYCAVPRNDGMAAPSKKWKRHFERGTPEESLTWKSARQRSVRMFTWQCAVSTKFASSVRNVRVAWLLGTLCQKEGYAFPTGDYISKTLGAADAAIGVMSPE
jgi:hypothetical protein